MMKTPEHESAAEQPAADSEPPRGREGELESRPHPLALAQPAHRWSDWLWRRGGVVWLTALACLSVAALIVWAESAPAGRVLTIRFRQGHGIAEGDPVKFRGIEVGRVRDVSLAESMHGVDVEIVLDAGAAGLARAGSRFWIERPRLGISRMSGLDTVVGPRYVNVQPGPETAELVTFLEGVEAPQSLLEIAPEMILVRFPQGFGLQQGDPVRLRGVAVGEVIGVQLDLAGQEVEVQLQLSSEYGALARQGTQFWVEYPQFGFQGVKGLDTLVGGRYIAVAPGPTDAPAAQEFRGLNEAPVTELDPEGVFFTLKGDERFGLQPGAPISYRGVRVGRVLNVRLAPDAGWVLARSYLAPEYRELLRANSRFWSVSGIDIKLGIRGFRLDADTLETIAAGGAAFATPDVPGPVVQDGAEFDVVNEPEALWLKWRPNLPWGDQLPQVPQVQ